MDGAGSVKQEIEIRDEGAPRGTQVVGVVLKRDAFENGDQESIHDMSLPTLLFLRGRDRVHHRRKADTIASSLTLTSLLTGKNIGKCYYARGTQLSKLGRGWVQKAVMVV